MKKIKALIVVMLFIVTSFTLVACGSNLPSAQTAEYYEIEYEDGSGIHVAKATRNLAITEIKIFTPKTIGFVTDWIEWEYNNLFYYYYSKNAESDVGSFANTTTANNFGFVSLHYGEELPDEYFKWWNNSYYMTSIQGSFININEANIVIDSQKITHFNIYKITSSDAEYRLEGMAENSLVYTQYIRCAIKVDYEGNATWSNIKLKEEGDFTTIQRSNLPDITIRTTI